ncbi:MAG: Gfo/Idh/MocA family oxidoreductase, partial [Acidobacteriota bacterium]
LAELVRLIEVGAVDFEALVGGSFTLDRAQDAFDAIRAGTLPGVAALLDYEASKPLRRGRTLTVGRGRAPSSKKRVKGKIGVGIIGCGNHTLGTHLPALAKLKGVRIRGLASATGKMAATVAKSVKASHVTTDTAAVFDDPATDAVMICSGHAQHAEHLRRGLRSGKALFVEKPLVSRVEDFAALLGDVEALDPEDVPLIALGLNRRYAPLVARLRDFLEGPVDSVTYHVTPPRIPVDHWTLDPVDGGGRLIAEAEHFIDLCHLLVDREPRRVTATALGGAPDDLRSLVNYTVTLDYGAATAHIIFNESGGAGHPRERLTVLAKGQVAILEDFEQLRLHGRSEKRIKQKRDMGHGEQLRQFVKAVRGDGGDTLLSWPETLRATTCLFAAQESLETGRAVDLDDFRRRLRDAGEEPGL